MSSWTGGGAAPGSDRPSRAWTAVALLLSLVCLLVAAKAHGRQVRLERVRAGYATVVFGGHNPPAVEAVWRRDRLRFWPTAGLALVLVIALLRVAPARGWPLPLGGGRSGKVLCLLLVPLLSAFVVAGLASLVGFIATRAVDEAFTTAALPGSAAWWSAVALSLALAAAALRRSARLPRAWSAS